MMFKSSFGPQAIIFHITKLDPSLDPHDDAYILFLTENDYIFAVSRVYNIDVESKQYFLNRVANYFHSKAINMN
jgi:hypothetical protein